MAQGKTRVTAATVAGAQNKAVELRRDAGRLDFLVEQGAIVRHGGKVDLTSPEPGQQGYWLEWPATGITQPGVFAIVRDAIDAATSASK